MAASDKINLSKEQLTALLDRLHAAPQGASGEHLTDTQIIDYTLEGISPTEQTVITEHMDACPACAARVEHILNQTRAWESAGGAKQLEKRRKELLQSTLDQLVPRTSLLGRLADELGRIVLRPPLALAPGYARAATPAIEAEGQSESGLLQWYYGLDETGSLVVRVSSFNTQLQGMRVLLRAGGWQRLVELELVEPGQVGVETVISTDELSQIDLSDGFRFELTT